MSVKVTKCQAYVTQKQTMSFGQVSEVFILYNLISLLLYGHNDKKLHLYEILIFKNKINYRMYMLVVARNVFVITSNDIKNRKSLVYFLLWFSLWQCWKDIKSITHISTIIDLTLLNIKIRTLYTSYLLIAVPQRYKVCILMLIKAILT